MKFEELNNRSENTLAEYGIEAFSQRQENLIKLSKQGKNQLIFTPFDQEITDGLHFISFMRAPEMLEGSPRVLWITPKWENAREQVKSFQRLMKRADVTIVIADDKGKIIEQRNAIFEGAEVIIGNPAAPLGTIRIAAIKGDRVRIAFDFPREMPVHRSEVAKEILEEQQQRRI